MIDNDIKNELDVLDLETERYWQEQDKLDETTDWNKVQEYQKSIFAEMLKGDLGKDINDVVSGKIKVKLPFKMKLKYWFENFFKLF